VNQQLYAVANQILEYAKQFPKPVIVMEDLNGMRGDFKMSKKLNRRFHSLHLEVSKPTLNMRLS
jgi:IS605 OrfB family transposase